MHREKRHFKGISPLIAVIMLIAFTLVVAGILAGWATNFATEQRTTIEQCIDARVIIYSASYSSPNISLVVYNNGKIPLNFRTILSYTDGSLEIDDTTESVEVSAGKVETLAIAPPSGPGFTNMEEITIQSNTCYGAQDYIPARNIKNFP